MTMKHNLEKLYEAGKRREGFVDMMHDSGFQAVVMDRGSKKLTIVMRNSILPQEAQIRDFLSEQDREQSVD